MKFKQIKIENFKSLEKLEYTPKNTTAFAVGKNGTGKTAFLEAFRALLTGDFPDGSIRKDCLFSNVYGILDDGTTIERTLNRSKTNKLKYNNRSVTLKTLNDALLTRTGVSKDSIKIVSSSKVVESLKPSEFGNFLMEYVPEKLDADIICSYIPDITPDEEAAIRDILPPMPVKFDIDTLQDVYETLFKQRAVLKKEAANRYARVSKEVPKPTRPLSVIDKELEVIIGKEASINSAKTAMKLYANAVDVRNKAIANVKKTKSDADSISASKPNYILIKTKEEAIKKQQEIIINAKSLMMTIKKDIAIFEESLKNISSTICPLSEKIVCTTNKEGAIDEIKEILRANKEGLTLQLSIIEKAEKEIEKIKKELDALNEENKQYERKVMLLAKYEELKKSIPSLPSKPEEIEEEEDFSEEKKWLEKEKRQINEYNQFIANKKEYELLARRVKIIDNLCKALNSKGPVIAKIMDYYLSIFEKGCNDRANELRPGFKVKLLSDQGISYQIKINSSDVFRSYESLSAGEKSFAMFLILDMLNTLSGFKIMILDDLDKLDEDAFEQLMAVIQSKEVQESYDHILLAGVNHENIVNTLKKYSVDMIF